jgi:hypothetical protein
MRDECEAENAWQEVERRRILSIRQDQSSSKVCPAGQCLRDVDEARSKTGLLRPAMATICFIKLLHVLPSASKVNFSKRLTCN